MVRWSDGVYGGLLAGVVSTIFFIVVGQRVELDGVFGDYFVRFADAVFGSRIDHFWVLALLFGLLLYFVAAVLFGVLYARVAKTFRPAWKAPTSILCGLTYGVVMYFMIEDVLVPVLGVTSYQPLWEGLVGSVFFHGIVMSEYITIAIRRNAARAAAQAEAAA